MDACWAGVGQASACAMDMEEQCAERHTHSGVRAAERPQVRACMSERRASYADIRACKQLQCSTNHSLSCMYACCVCAAEWSHMSVCF